MKQFARLLQILGPLMLRRLKVDVDMKIPPKKEVIVYVPLTEQQYGLYISVLDGSIGELSMSLVSINHVLLLPVFYFCSFAQQYEACRLEN